MWEYLDALRQGDQLSELDLHFGRMLTRLGACDTPELVMAACSSEPWDQHMAMSVSI